MGVRRPLLAAGETRTSVDSSGPVGLARFELMAL
jgi:hypothetical protein